MMRKICPLKNRSIFGWCGKNETECRLGTIVRQAIRVEEHVNRLIEEKIQSGEYSSDLTIWNEEASALIHEACGFRLKINPRQKSDNPHGPWYEFDHNLFLMGKNRRGIQNKENENISQDQQSKK